MQYILNDKKYDVLIVRKNIKNIYIKERDGKIYVTCNKFTLESNIKKLMDNNKGKLTKMLSKKENQDKFYYLGKYYDIIYNEDITEPYILDNYLYTKDDAMLNKWLDINIQALFNREYHNIYESFLEINEKYLLKIKKLKSRWGSNNRHSKIITLNKDLIKYDIRCLRYVIIHEMAHQVHFDHSKNFWNLVKKYVPNYKEIKEVLK